MNPILGIAVTLGLLAANALFVAAEFALIGARRSQLEPDARAGSRSARMALRAIEDVSVVMAASVGVTLASLGLGAVSEPTFAAMLEPLFEAVHMPHELVHPVAFVIAMTVVVFAHVVLGEMVPKNLALVGPERAARVLGPFMLAVMFVLRPVVLVLNGIANLFIRAMGVQPRGESDMYTHDEVAGLVDESRREGLLDEDEYGLVTGALDFTGGTVDQVLLPMDELVTMTPASTLAAVEDSCASTGYSRFPVVGDGGDLIGYLHVKDVLASDDGDRERALSDAWLLRPLATVEPNARLFDALRTMQARGSHMARVADASGTTLGVVMLEDVLEELVGEVSQR